MPCVTVLRKKGGWATKVSRKTGKAVISKRTGKPIRFRTMEGSKKNLPKSLKKLRSFLGSNRFLASHLREFLEEQEEKGKSIDQETLVTQPLAVELAKRIEDAKTEKQADKIFTEINKQMRGITIEGKNPSSLIWDYGVDWDNVNWGKSVWSGRKARIPAEPAVSKKLKARKVKTGIYKTLSGKERDRWDRVVESLIKRDKIRFTIPYAERTVLDYYKKYGNVPSVKEALRVDEERFVKGLKGRLRTIKAE